MQTETITDCQVSLADGLRLRKPSKADGSDVWALIGDCDPLDENSIYCNLIQCDHFRDTCVLAELHGEVVGWLSAYLPPGEEGTVFVWQVAVSDKARGKGLGLKMLNALLERPECADVTNLQTTITQANEASWALFTKLAETSGAVLSSQPYFRRDAHFDGEQPTEHLVTIDFAEPFKKAV